jgi:hypothetical protein
VRFLVPLCCLAALGCTAEISEPLRRLMGTDTPAPTQPGPTDPTDPTVTPTTPPPEPVVPVTQVRRLTRSEYDATLALLVGDSKHTALGFLPGEAFKPFDNGYAEQQASAIWVEAAEHIAEAVTADVLADPARRSALLPCTPTGSGDTACLQKFARSFGRLALRRPLTDAEVVEFTDLHALAIQRGDFFTSMGLVMRRLLQDPEFVFRVELGTPVDGQPGTFALNAFEVASRLSFLLQGRTPPAWLLDAAEAGQLQSADEVRAAAQRLLDAPEGRLRIEQFHAMWLGYSSLPHPPAFNTELVTETSALVRKVIFEDKADYRGLFLAEQTYVDDPLATHYGLPVTGQPGFHWVSYPAGTRKGILSHGSVLSNGVKQTDTSPTLRGKWIRNRLFCQEIPPPPPNVVADVPPPSQNGVVCKKDRYSVHDSTASCAGCHKQMDPIGFGLEGYDRTGKFRDREADHPECLITGEGNLEGVGSFKGPSGLADLMVTTGAVESCVVKQVFRFASGRLEKAEDQGLLYALTQSFNQRERRFDQLLLDLVTHPTFAQRRLEAP